MEHAKANENIAEFCMYNMLDGFYNTGQTDKKNNPVWEDLCNYIMTPFNLKCKYIVIVDLIQQKMEFFLHNVNEFKFINKY